MIISDNSGFILGVNPNREGELKTLKNPGKQGLKAVKFNQIQVDSGGFRWIQVKSTKKKKRKRRRKDGKRSAAKKRPQIALATESHLP